MRFSQIDRENARDAGRFDSYYLLMILGLDMSCRVAGGSFLFLLLLAPSGAKLQLGFPANEPSRCRLFRYISRKLVAGI